MWNIGTLKRQNSTRGLKVLPEVSNLDGIYEELNNYSRFRDRISGLASTLKDMNTLTPDMHRDSDFSDLYIAVEERIKENNVASAPARQPELVNTIGHRILRAGDHPDSRGIHF
jgi:hypothetical protein